MNRVPKHIVFITFTVSLIMVFAIIAYKQSAEIKASMEADSESSETLDTLKVSEGETFETPEIVSIPQEADTEAEPIAMDTLPEVAATEQEPATQPLPTFIFKTKDLENLSDQAYFNVLKDEYITHYTNGLLPGRSRTDVIIRYYKRSGDNESGITELQEMGYYIHEKDATDDTFIYTSNFIAYGQNTRKEDIQMVAYTLLKNGIPIKQIRPSKYGTGWKANVIEIGCNLALSESSLLSLRDIRDIEK